MANILLVEDNEMNRDLLRRRLKRHGHHISLATNGQEAIDSVRASPPEVVLMDMGLPVIDGWTATYMLKQDPATRTIPIIALTGHVMAADRQRALDAGCDSFQTKPVDLPARLAEIQRFTNSAPAAQA
ncbi:MAG: response regulator [Verrucomicrobia bacterium]|nr:response regulator [Verrucomicrobiota bacterium]